jgi:hypothetical protein
MAFLTYARAFATTAASLEYSRGQINGYIPLGVSVRAQRRHWTSPVEYAQIFRA